MQMRLVHVEHLVEHDERHECHEEVHAGVDEHGAVGACLVADARHLLQQMHGEQEEREEHKVNDAHRREHVPGE